MGDLLSSAYPEVLKVSFPEMFKEMFMIPYTVKVNLRRVNNKAINSVHGKILAFISDGHRHSVPFRAGSTVNGQFDGDSSEAILALERSVVVVPSGWVLRIEVDLCIKIRVSNRKRPLQDKLLKATLIFDKESLSQSQTPEDTGIEVEVTITRVEDYMQYFPAQLSRPVEVNIEQICGHALVPAPNTLFKDIYKHIHVLVCLTKINSLNHAGRNGVWPSNCSIHHRR
jgi:hypothetical protein